MVENFIESKESFIISFGGKTSIDAKTFSQTIDSTIELLKESAFANDPNCFIKLEIKANQVGSFETIIDMIIRHKNDLLKIPSIAGDILEGLLNFLSIKKHLKGKKAKKIESNQTETAIQNQDNEIKKFSKKIGNIYFQNNKIDNLIINQFTNLSEDKRSNYIIKTSGAEIIINENSFENMKQVLVDENPIVKTIKQKPISVDLLVKKPDLLGDSKWQFIYIKNIEAKIEDELFLEKVRNRQIVILAGDKINCELEIEYDLTERLEIIPKSEKYNIKKINGEIIKPEEDNQKSLFE
jgi:hypothetical protein